MRFPERWGRGRLKWDTRIVAGGTPNTDEISYWLDGEDTTGTPFVAIADMSRRERVTTTTKSLTSEGLASRNMPVGRPGTLLLAMYASVGELAFLDIEATWNQAILGITPDTRRFEPRFLRYVLLDRRDVLLRDVRTNTQANLNASQVGDLWLQRPALAEQYAIADHLDHETAKIDTLIEEQQKLIEMLLERRDAVWDAEFDRLAGSSPVVAVRRLIESIVDGPFGSSLTSAHYVDDGARVVRLGNIGINEFKMEDAAYISTGYAAQLSAHSVRAGDVVIAGLGDDKMPLGRAAVVPEIGPAIVKADCYRVRPSPAVTAAYLAWALSAPLTRSEMALLGRGATRARLNTSVVKEIAIPAPPIDIQREVVDRTTEQLAKIDTLIAETERFIELSRERRAALITAAVTGQIDVRDRVGVGAA